MPMISPRRTSPAILFFPAAFLFFFSSACDSSRPELPLPGDGGTSAEVNRGRSLPDPLKGETNPPGPALQGKARDAGRGKDGFENDPARLLERLKKDPSEEAAYQALKRMGPPVIPWILKEVRNAPFRNGTGRPSWQSRVVILLSEMGSPAVPRLSASLSDADPKVRLVSVLALASMGRGAAGAAASLEAAAKDPDERVRLAARGALLHLKPKRTPPQGPPVKIRDGKGREVHSRK